jgi:hypothetical protein
LILDWLALVHLLDRAFAPHEAFPIMTDAIASSLGSMMVEYELLISGPDGHAIDGGGYSASCCSNFCDPARSRLAVRFFPFEQSRNTDESQVVETKIFNAEESCRDESKGGSELTITLKAKAG